MCKRLLVVKQGSLVLGTGLAGPITFERSLLLLAATPDLNERIFIAHSRTTERVCHLWVSSSAN